MCELARNCVVRPLKSSRSPPSPVLARFIKSSPGAKPSWNQLVRYLSSIEIGLIFAPSFYTIYCTGSWETPSSSSWCWSLPRLLHCLCHHIVLHYVSDTCFIRYMIFWHKILIFSASTYLFQVWLRNHISSKNTRISQHKLLFYILPNFRIRTSGYITQ